MTAKYIFWALAIIALLGLLGGAYLLGRSSIKAETKQVYASWHVTQPIITEIKKEHVPALIDTLYNGSGEPHEVAQYSAVIDTNRVNVDMAIRYDEQTNLFDLIRFKATGTRDSVYVEKPVIIREKRPWIALYGAIGIGANRDKTNNQIGLDSACADLGVRLGDRWTVTAFVDTRRVFGLRVGTQF